MEQHDICVACWVTDGTREWKARWQICHARLFVHAVALLYLALAGGIGRVQNDNLGLSSYAQEEIPKGGATG